MRPTCPIRTSRTSLVLFAVGVLALGACHDNVDTGALHDATDAPDLPTPPTCPASSCDISGVCVADGAPDPNNACMACVVPVDRTRYSANDAGVCDDQDACTDADHCAGGACVGAPRVCDDADPCTKDHCDADTGTCVAEVAPELCDGDPCAAEPAPDCDDADPCTADRCEAGVGCVHAPAMTAADPDAGPPTPGDPPAPGEPPKPIPCDDGNPCTGGDVCDDRGECLGTDAVNCDDGDLCTLDVCRPPRDGAPGGCDHPSIAHLCGDANPCTDETCDPGKGCVYPFNTVSCDDHNACTIADTCTGGACLGTLLPLDDLNPCTDDACDATIGVVHVPNIAPCDDLNVCTVADMCHKGACEPGSRQLACDDENGCTDDRCEPGNGAGSGCVFEPHTRACDDLTACTENDVCGSSVCKGTRVNCDDGNACTADSCSATLGCQHQLIVSDTCRPTITVTYPPRGATLTRGAGMFGGLVFVSGSVTSGAGAITSLTLDGVAVTVREDSTFTGLLAPDFGGNIMVLEATDAMGSTRKRVQSFTWSSGYQKPTTPKNGIVTQGVGVWLDDTAIDDGTRGSPPNDLASILQIALRSMDIADFIPRPATTFNVPLSLGSYKVYVNNMTYLPPTVSLRPQSGGIHLTGTITSGYADIKLSRSDCAFICVIPGTINGSVTFTSMVINIDLALSVSGNDIVVTVQSSDVQINGLVVSIDTGISFLDPLVDAIVSLFSGSIATSLETGLNDQLAPVIGPLVRDGLRELAFNVPFDVPSPTGANIPIDMVTDFQAVSCSTAGCQLTLRAGVYADTKRTPYDNDGVPNRGNCGSGTQALTLQKARALELSMADDTLNQVLFAVWRGGILEFNVPAAWLQGVNLAQYGIANLTMTVSGMLAPTASDCAGAGLEAHLGDIKIHAHMTLFGTPVDFDVWASAFIGVTVALSGDNIALAIDGIKRAEIEVDVLNDSLISLEPVIADLIETQVLPTAIEQLGTNGQLAAFPLPNIDLSGAIAGLPAGTGIHIVPQVIVRDNGNTIAGGRLQ